MDRSALRNREDLKLLAKLTSILLALIAFFEFALWGVI